MAFATDIRTKGAESSLRNRISAFFVTLAERREQSRVYRDTLAELQRLTDRDLADLGIAPANIRQVAYEAAYGK